MFGHAHLGLDSRTDSRLLRAEYCIVGIPYITASHLVVVFVSQNRKCSITSIGQTVAEVWRFNGFPNSDRLAFYAYIFKISKFQLPPQSRGAVCITVPNIVDADLLL